MGYFLAGLRSGDGLKKKLDAFRFSGELEQAVTTASRRLPALLSIRANCSRAHCNSQVTPAHLLLMRGWPWEHVGELFSTLARGGANLSVADNHGQTPLHYLAGLGDASPLSFIRGISDCFSAAKLNVQVRDNQGDTPLHIAVRTGTRDVYGWLLNKGAALDATNNAGETPRLLVAQTKNPFFAIGHDPETDISEAIREGRLEPLEKIFKADSKLVNEPTRFRQTPLRTAVLAHRTNVIDFLVQHGAKWDAISEVMIGRPEALRELLAKDPSTLANSPDVLHNRHTCKRPAPNADITGTCGLR